MAQFTEEERLVRRIEQRFNKGVVKYRLIEEGDKILVETLWPCSICWHAVRVS